MAYFTAVLARTGSHWKARDIEVDEFDSLDDLADALRGVAHESEPVLALVEHEDEWFALVRVDGEDDPRVFVSDLYAASRSPFSELLAPAADVEDDELEDETDAGTASATRASAAEHDEGLEDEAIGRDEGDDENGNDADGPDESSAPQGQLEAWAGESDLLNDLGVSGPAMRALVEAHAQDPALVIGEVGEIIGFADQLEALR